MQTVTLFLLMASRSSNDNAQGSQSRINGRLPQEMTQDLRVCAFPKVLNFHTKNSRHQRYQVNPPYYADFGNILFLPPVLKHFFQKQYVSLTQSFNYPSSLELIPFSAYSAPVTTAICKAGGKKGEEYCINKGFYLCRILH